MNLEDLLVEQARYHADRMYGTRAPLEDEFLGLEKRKSEIEAQLKAIKFAERRILEYRPTLGAVFQCPRCWVQKEIRASLRAMSTGTKDDLLRCDTCGFEIPVLGNSS
jgi:hypothetical protein